LKKQNFRLTYQYQNSTEKDVELWFSEPKESSTQQNITINPSMSPEKVTEHSFLNHLWYYNLKPGQKLAIDIDYYGN